MPTPGWGAVIQGAPADLSAWQHKLKHHSDSDIWVETHDSETVLRATSLNELESADEVGARAIAYIDRLNGAMALSSDSRPVQLRAVIRFTPEGHLQRTLFVESIKFEARGFVIAAATGGTGPAPAPSEAQRWSAMADQETWLDDALMYFGKATNWFDTYKTLECLIDRFDGGDPIKFLKRDWAPADKVKRLRETANSFRHGRRRPNRKPPENPMKPEEARELLGQLVRRALEEAAK